jgi:hypothetical protein
MGLGVIPGPRVFPCQVVLVHQTMKRCKRPAQQINQLQNVRLNRRHGSNLASTLHLRQAQAQAQQSYPQLIAFFL